MKAKVAADDKGKDRPFAELQGRKGIIEGVPAGHALNVGDEVELVIKVLGVDGKQITFKWPT